ncbi:MAG TPA: hypothetical protein VL728_09305 [Cyclobacteriaceae bacterium]|jgi:hypothetical protein|nr:hypothetical protein [Cyclobacteriaceae bacterium]
MESLKKTLFIIAMVSITGYTIRHIYLKWMEPHSSVLDKYDKPITGEIRNAKSLKQLEDLYAEAHKKVLVAEPNDSIKGVPPYQRYDREPYKSESELRDAIVQWESQSNEIFQIRFYWVAGILLVIVGYGLYQKINPWLGVAVLIIGFGEMVYWTSPTFFRGAGFEYDRLLDNKIVLSLATLVLLIVAGFFTNTLKVHQK